MTPQEIRLLSSEAIRSKIEDLKQTAQLLSTTKEQGDGISSYVKSHTAKMIAELEETLFNRG